jgi:predicted MFS family arabinose efflux permease
MSDFRGELRTGWRDLVGATLGLACGAAMYTPIQSLFFRALLQEFHWSRATLAGALFALPLTAIMMPAVGRLIDRHGVRPISVISVVLLSASFIWLAFIGNSPLSFYAGIFAFNILGAATTPISYTRPIAQSFVGSRGTAIAVASSGIAVAGIVLPPILGPLLAEGDWRLGFEIVAALSLVGGIVAVLLIRPSGSGQGKGGEGWGLTRSEALRTGSFWKLGIAIFAVGGASVGFVSQLQSVAMEFGVPLAQTLFVLSATSLSTLCFRVLSGWALDATSPQRVAAVFVAVSAVGQLIWLLPMGTLGIAITAAVFLGIALGSEHVFMAFFCARLFGLRAYSAIFGALNVFLYFGMAAGAMLFALTHDFTSSYGFAIGAAVLLMIGSAALFLALPGAVAARAHAGQIGRDVPAAQRSAL